MAGEWVLQVKSYDSKNRPGKCWLWPTYFFFCNQIISNPIQVHGHELLMMCKYCVNICKCMDMCALIMYVCILERLEFVHLYGLSHKFWKQFNIFWFKKNRQSNFNVLKYESSTDDEKEEGTPALMKPHSRLMYKSLRASLTSWWWNVTCSILMWL